MKTFSAVDYGVVIGYLLVIAAIGSSFYRRKTTAKEYFLGGRSMWWLPVGISLIAADLSAISVMGSPAWSFRNNMMLLWLSVGYPLMAPVVIKVFVPFYARLNLYTAYEYLEKRFNVSVRAITSLLFQLLRVAHVALVIYAPSLVINLVTGMPVWQCVLLMGVFTTFYTTLGGMRAVIWTDVIQFCTVSLGITLIFVTAVGSVDGGLPVAYRTALEGGRLEFFNLSTDPKELTSLWACLIGGMVLCMSPLTTDQAILQRLFTTKSEQDCRRSIILQCLLIIPIGTLLYLAGVALYSFYKLNPSRIEGLSNPDAVMPLFAVRELPVGISGLIIAAIFAASMAVMSAGINSLTTATIVDFYQRMLRPGRSPEHYAMAGRVGTALWGTAATLLALHAGRLGALALAYNKVSSYLSGPLLGIFLLATLTRRANSAGVLMGAAAGSVVVASVAMTTEWSFVWYGPIGVVVTFATGYSASLLGPAPPASSIEGFVIGSQPAERREAVQSN